MTASHPDTATAEARSCGIESQTYTFTDIAGLCKCSVRSVRRWNDQRLIPGCFRVGRLIRFNKKQIDAWLAAGGSRRR